MYKFLCMLKLRKIIMDNIIIIGGRILKGRKDFKNFN